MNRALFVAAILGLAAAGPTVARTKQFSSDGHINIDAAQGYVVARMGPLDHHRVGLPVTLYRIDPASSRLRTADRHYPMTIPHGEDAMATLGGSFFMGHPNRDAPSAIAISRLTPGEYVIAAVGNTCLCMGSYRFTVRPGEITDLGTLTAVPDDGPLNEDLRHHNMPLIARLTVTPATSDLPAPDVVATLPRRVAEMIATRFDNEGMWMVGRMDGLPAMEHETTDTVAAAIDRRHEWGTVANRWPDINPPAAATGPQTAGSEGPPRQASQQ